MTRLLQVLRGSCGDQNADWRGNAENGQDNSRLVAGTRHYVTWIYV
jgi:hypothetical protein